MPYQCNKCNSDMEEGFVLEIGDGGMASSEVWVAGKPEKSLIAGVKLKGRSIYDVASFRCIACGYLDSYALSKH